MIPCDGLQDETRYDRRHGESRIVGLKVISVGLDDDRLALTLTGTRGEDGTLYEYELCVEGDCCSYSWIEGVYEESALIGHTILKAKDVELPPEFASREPQHIDAESIDSLDAYGFAIYTERGRFLVDFRNNSNGYYGGSLYIRTIAPQVEKV